MGKKRSPTVLAAGAGVSMVVQRVHGKVGDVTRASSVEECVRLARDLRPDFIFMDELLPDGTAADAMRRIQEDPSLAEIPSAILQSGPSSQSELFKLLLQPGGLLSALPEMFCIVDTVGRIVDVSPSSGPLLGLAPDQLRGRHVLDFIHPDDRAAAEARLKRLSDEESPPSFETRWVTSDGAYRWLSLNAARMPGRDLIFAVARDVSTQKADEDTLRTFSRVIEQSPVSVMITNRHGSIEYVNPRFTEISGFTKEELIGQNPRIMNSGKQTAELYDQLWHTITKGAVWQGVLQNKKKNGDLFWEHEVIAPVRDPEGVTTHYVSIKEDVTEQRLAGDTIRRQAALLDVATDAILMHDLDDHILYWNKGAEQIYGWTAREVIGKKVVDVIYPGREQYLASTKALIRDGHWRGELTQKSRDNKLLTVECRWTIAADGDGTSKTVLAINTDVTEKRKMEAQFLRAQRMESIGTLASGIAHDLNNILGPIMLSIDFLKEKSTDEQTLRMLQALESSTHRGADLVRQVLMFAKGVQGERLPLQPGQIIEDVVKILRETFPRAITITSAVPEGLWQVTGDPTQLHQVLMNLSVNARDAMPDGGELHIAAENTTLDEHYVKFNLEARVGPHVTITITDTGGGIPPNVLPRIFDPFYTTKEPGKGTGIGLSTVRAIAKGHQGFINVYSEMRKGSTFKLYLPANGTEKEIVQPADVRTAIPRGQGELVLVVDDELSILEVTRTLLEAFGYRVMTAQDGTEALAVYSGFKNEVSVVITDMMMPYLDGSATIRALRKINPRVKIIAASGLEINSSPAIGGRRVDAFLAKPYTGEKLLTTLSQVLSSEAP